MKKVLPWLIAVALFALLAACVWALPLGAQQDSGQGASVCLQWATVTPVAPCNCAPTATPTIRVRPPISPSLSLELPQPEAVLRQPPPAAWW
jgi:hypothetical protein